MPVRCSNILPEHQVDTGETEEVIVMEEERNDLGTITRERQTMQRPIIETVPEQQCKNNATAIERHLEEVQTPGMHGTQLKILKDVPKCDAHVESGKYHHLNGIATNSPAYPISDDSGIR